MIEKKPMIASLLSIISGVLIFINVLLEGINKGPIVVSTYSVSSPQEIMSSNSSFWARISFGFKGWSEGLWIPLWMILASVILYCALMLYIKPITRKTLCFLIVILSILSIPFGGGFIIGSVLGVIGGFIGFEWPRPYNDTFMGKILRAAKLDSAFYASLKEDPHALKDAAYVMIFMNFLSGIGSAFYVLMSGIIVNAQSLNIPFRILLLGEFILDSSVLSTSIINIGVAILKWITLSIIFYFVGILLIGEKVTMERIAAAVAFAYVPIGLQFFMPFVLTSKPYLTSAWPFALVLVTNLWMILALIVSIRQLFEVPLGRAVGATSLVGAIYLIVNQKFFMNLDIPYTVKIFLQPEPVLLTMIASLCLLATLLGVFTRH